MANKVDWALDAVGRGWAVFPCLPNSKLPAVKTGFKAATKDIEQVKYWWRQNPDYNIGIRTGSESGLTVLDIDNRDEYTNAGYPFIDSYMVHTPNGGLHYYLGDSELKNSVKKLQGADIRGEGGYVVGAGSVIEGRTYELNIDNHIAGVPQWLKEELDKKPEYVAPVELQQGDIAEGGRNNYLTQVAGTLQRKGLLNLTVLLTINEEQCTPPLGEEEVEQIYNSVSGYAVEDPIIPVIEEKPYIKLSELYPEMKKALMDKAKIKGQPTGFEELDHLLGGGLREGELTGFCAIAKTGKSSFIHQVIYNLISKDIPVGYASREMRPHDEVSPNLFSIHYNENAWKEEYTDQRDSKYHESMDIWPLYFAKGYGTFLIDRFEPWVIELKKLGVKYFFVDHLHYCLEDPEEYKEAVKLIQHFKRIVNEQNIHIFSIIQPTKIHEGMTLGLHALRGGAGIGQAIDTLMTFERYIDRQTNVKSNEISRLRVSDVRHKLARTGELYLKYNHNTTKFEEVRKEIIITDEMHGANKTST